MRRSENSKKRADNANSPSKSQQPWGWGNRDDTSSWHLTRLKATFRRQICPKNKHCCPREPLSPRAAKGCITPASCSHCQRGTGDREAKNCTRGPAEDTAKQEQPLWTLICRLTLQTPGNLASARTGRYSHV